MTQHVKENKVISESPRQHLSYWCTMNSPSRIVCELTNMMYYSPKVMVQIKPLVRKSSLCCFGNVADPESTSKNSNTN